MYIPYDKIGESIALFLPVGLRKCIRKFSNELKIRANCAYIEKNVKKVQKKLAKKALSEKIKVVFVIYDETKWKCQSLYDLFNESPNFCASVLVTKNCSKKGNFNYQSIEDIKRVYNFFKNKNLNVEYAYNLESDCFIPLENFKPDIIIYQHPWYIETSQGPVKCSRFALTHYVPYYLPNTTLPQDYYLRFHGYVHKYYVLNQSLIERYSKLMSNKGKNLVAAGSPQLDYFYLNKEKKDERKYLIFAPHWSVNHKNTIAYSTFLWSGRLILEFAKKHPELNWIFKPHPLLKSALITNKYWSEKEVDDYYNEWDKIGLKYESGDYFDLFQKSYAMITDCGSFLGEFFMTKMPVIRMVSPDAVECYDFIEKIISLYYNAHNEEELKNYLQDIIINKNDPKKQQRLEMYRALGLENNFCAKNIIDDIKKELKIK